MFWSFTLKIEILNFLNEHKTHQEKPSCGKLLMGFLYFIS